MPSQNSAPFGSSCVQEAPPRMRGNLCAVPVLLYGIKRDVDRQHCIVRRRHQADQTGKVMQLNDDYNSRTHFYDETTIFQQARGLCGNIIASE